MEEYEKPGSFYLGRQYDAAAGALKSDLVLYDSRHLTTHAICVGMTGSGKTGLCLATLEEAALDGIPAICIDPKGDLSNLLLTFPSLLPADFQPWIDPAEAQRQGISIEQLAEKTAQTWKSGLSEWNEPPERIARFKASVDISVYTPGSESGLPLSILKSFEPPSAALIEDSAAFRDRITGAASSILALLGRDADPVQSRDHTLLSNIFEQSWRRGASLDITSLIGAIQKPPFDKIGAFDLETFYPSKDRVALAIALNNLLASPGFSAWMTGEPLDAQRLLYTADGRPRISILSISHLSDAERMFIVTLVLNELITWMRGQPGTGSLRALFYMDEIFGYFPPTAVPPSKPPMLTLLKQGRAFGLGCMLATQNPADLDYKGLSNAGTWFIGRLQTERDKMRLLDGLDSALSSSSGYDRAALEKLLSGLTQRVFLLRDVALDAPLLFKSRWALSYLRGPLTGAEISRLMAQKKSEARRGASAPAVTAKTTPDVAFPRPAVPAEVPEYFLPSSGTEGTATYQPRVMGIAKLHFVDAKLGLDQWQTLEYLAPFDQTDGSPRWTDAAVSTGLKQKLVKNPAENSSFAPLPAVAMRAGSYATWKKSLSAFLYETARATVLVCDALKMTSAPGESESDFRARLPSKGAAQHDAAVAALRASYATKFAALDTREHRAEDTLDRQHSQLTQQKVQTAVSVVSTVFGALLGRKLTSATNVNRAASAARSASKWSQESADVDRANQDVQTLHDDRTALQAQLDAEIAALEQSINAASTPLRAVQTTPRKSDIGIDEVALVWRMSSVTGER